MPQCCAQLFHTPWHHQIDYDHDISWVYHQALFAYHMAQQDPKRDTKQTFL